MASKYHFLSRATGDAYNIFFSTENLFIKILLPFYVTVFKPFSHDGMVGFQVHGDIFVLWVKLVAELLKTTVLWVPAGRMSQIIDYLRHCHFP